MRCCAVYPGGCDERWCENKSFKLTNISPVHHPAGGHASILIAPRSTPLPELVLVYTLKYAAGEQECPEPPRCRTFVERHP